MLIIDDLKQLSDFLNGHEELKIIKQKIDLTIEQADLQAKQNEIYQKLQELNNRKED